MDFEIIEADFQQFYNLDVSKLRFRRYARLLTNLPPESRFFRKYSPLKEWNWDKEVQSQILMALDILIVNHINANRKKGASKIKYAPQFQPDYVRDAKTKLKNENKVTEEEKEDLREFFERRNHAVNKLTEELEKEDGK